MTNTEIFKQFLIRQALVNRYIRRSQTDFLKVLDRADRDLLEVAIAAVDNIGNKSLITRTGARALDAVGDVLETARKGTIEPLIVDFLDELRELVADQVAFNKSIAEDTEVGKAEGINEPDKENDFLLYPMDGRTIDEWWAVFFAGDAGRLMGQVRTGMMAGETDIELLKRLRGSTGTTANSLKSLIPTLVTGAVAFGNHIFDEANPEIVKRERYTAILDNRTSMLCASLDGNIYKVGEGPHPPMHRSCRSQRIPIYEGAGASVPRVSYEEWLKEQPVAVQNQVLGKAKGVLFREGNLSITDMLRKNGTPMTLGELKDSSASVRKLLN